MLLKSRKFWLTIMDVVISLTTYFVTKYVDPASAKDVMIVIGSLQPVVISLIASITVQNIEGIKATANTERAKAYAAVENK